MESRPKIGWREWVVFPDFHGARVKAKIDTGARTSAIHAWNIEVTSDSGKQFVSFALHPRQKDNEHVIRCTAEVIDVRSIRNSGGDAQERYLIRTNIEIGTHCWPIELSLTNRDEMGFRMLLGRQAIRSKFLVDPGASYALSGPSTEVN